MPLALLAIALGGVIVFVATRAHAPTTPLVPVRVFPVALDGQPHFSNDFGAPRGTSDHPRKHQGIDIFATEGAPVLAPDDGLLRYYVDPTGGPSFTIDNGGLHYYGTHLSGYVTPDGEIDTRGSGAATTVSPRRVRAGEPIARVGHTGNASGTSPHLHFQVAINGHTINPYPFLVAAQKTPGIA